MSNDETPSHVHNLLKQTGVNTYETWTCSPTMFSHICNSFSNAEEPNEQWKCKPYANLDFTLVRQMRKREGASFDVLVIHSVLHYFRICFVFKFEMLYVVLPPLIYAYDATTRIWTMFNICIVYI